MKKKYLAVFLLLVSLCFTACSLRQGSNMPTDNVYHPETDYPFMYGDAEMYMAESPDGYYFIDGNFLYFIDKETMQAVPLCGKPNCKHQHEMDPAKVADCDAYMDRSRAGTLLEFLDGHLYISVIKKLADPDSGMVLLQMKPDGTERKKLAELPKTVGEAILHRGYLYYTATAFDEELNARYGIYRQDLNGGEPEMVCEGTQKNMGHFTGLTAYGNYLFFNEAGVNEENLYWMRAMRCDLKSGEKTEAVICPNKKADPMCTSFVNGKVVTAIYHWRDQEDPDNDQYYDFYMTNLDGSNQTELELPFDKQDYTWNIGADGKNLWRYTIPWQMKDQSVLQKLDENYQVIAEYPDSYGRNSCILWGGEDYLFLKDNADGEEVLYAIGKNPTDGILKAQECYRSGEQSSHVSFNKDSYTEIGDR